MSVALEWQMGLVEEVHCTSPHIDGVCGHLTAFGQHGVSECVRVEVLNVFASFHLVFCASAIYHETSSG